MKHQSVGCGDMYIPPPQHINLFNISYDDQVILKKIVLLQLWVFQVVKCLMDFNTVTCFNSLLHFPHLFNKTAVFSKALLHYKACLFSRGLKDQLGQNELYTILLTSNIVSKPGNFITFVYHFVNLPSNLSLLCPKLFNQGKGKLDKYLAKLFV